MHRVIPVKEDLVVLLHLLHNPFRVAIVLDKAEEFLSHRVLKYSLGLSLSFHRTAVDHLVLVSGGLFAQFPLRCAIEFSEFVRVFAFTSWSLRSNIGFRLFFLVQALLVNIVCFVLLKLDHLTF